MMGGAVDEGVVVEVVVVEGVVDPNGGVVVFELVEDGMRLVMGAALS